MTISIGSRQTHVDVNNFPKIKEISRQLVDIINIIRKYSRFHYRMLTLSKCGEGAESIVLAGDVPGINVVAKMPKPDENGNIHIETPMEETHMI